MKKIFTLLFVAGMFTMAQAQSGTRDNRQTDQRGYQQNDQRSFNNTPTKANDVVIFDKDGRYNDKFSMERKRDMEIAQINREYDLKVQKVQRSFFLTWFAKQRQIRSLEQQRQREIQMVYVKYTYSRKSYNGRDDHSNGHY